MDDGCNGGTRLARIRDRLTRWRERYGGPGIPLPDELWAEAAEVARVEGVGATARALRVDRARLAARVDDDPAGAADADGEAGERFVELDAGRLCLGSRTVLRFQGRDGERLEVELGPGTAVDVAALATAFWDRQR